MLRQSTFRKLFTSALALVGLLLSNPAANGSPTPFLLHADLLAESAVLGDADPQLNFSEIQQHRQDFEVFHGTLDTRRFRGYYWVHLRWAPSSEPLLLQFRHGDNKSVALFYPAIAGGCLVGNLPQPSLRSNSISGWESIPLCQGTTEAYLRVATPTGYPRVAFRITTVPKAAALDFIEIAAVFAAGGLGLIASLLALFRLVRRKNDVLAIGFIVEQLTRIPFWVNTLDPPHYTNIGKVKELATKLPIESWRMLLVLGLLVFMQALVQRGKRRSPWHHALGVLTAGGVIAYGSTFFLNSSDYTLTAWGLLIVSLPVSVVAALGGVAVNARTPADAFGNQPLHLANWALAGIATLAWVTTAIALSEPTPDVALMGAIPFYLVVAISVIIEAAEESRRAFAEALQQRLARESAEREAEQQNRQHKETRDLLLMLTHELRTPLGVLRFSLDAVPAMPSARARAEEAIRNMDSLVERCLQAAHLEADSTAETPETWNAAQEVPLLVGQCTAPERIQLDIDPATPMAVTRRGVLALVISVLIDNALKYGANQAPVRIQVAPAMQNDQPGVMMLVDNQPGPTGLPDPKRLFQKYYRSAGAHQHTGAGLGLFLSARLVASFGGELTYVPLPAVTRFQLWIPC